MTRLFREGRTETVRPVTIESSAWVKSMVDPLVSVEDRRALLIHACNRHQKGYQDAMCGKGLFLQKLFSTFYNYLKLFDVKLC